MTTLTWEDLDVSEYTTQRRVSNEWPAKYVKAVAHEAMIVIGGDESPAEVVGLINAATILILDSEVPPATPEEIKVDSGNDGIVLTWYTTVSSEVIEAERAENRKRIEDNIARLTKQLEEYK